MAIFKKPSLFGSEPPWNVEPWEIKPQKAPPPKDINDYDTWQQAMRAIERGIVPPDFIKKIDELMADKEETKPVSPPTPTSAVFSVERHRNGYLVSVTGNGKWVCGDDAEQLLNVIKMALADARLV